MAGDTLSPSAAGPVESDDGHYSQEEIIEQVSDWKSERVPIFYRIGIFSRLH